MKKYIITEEQLCGLVDYYWKQQQQLSEGDDDSVINYCLKNFRFEEYKATKKSLLERQTEATEKIADKLALHQEMLCLLADDDTVREAMVRHMEKKMK